MATKNLLVTHSVVFSCNHYRQLKGAKDLALTSRPWVPGNRGIAASPAAPRNVRNNRGNCEALPKGPWQSPGAEGPGKREVASSLRSSQSSTSLRSRCPQLGSLSLLSGARVQGLTPRPWIPACAGMTGSYAASCFLGSFFRQYFSTRWSFRPVWIESKCLARISQQRSRASSIGMFTSRSINSFSKSSP